MKRALLLLLVALAFATPVNYAAAKNKPSAKRKKSVAVAAPHKAAGADSEAALKTAFNKFLEAQIASADMSNELSKSANEWKDRKKKKALLDYLTSQNNLSGQRLKQAEALFELAQNDKTRFAVGDRAVKTLTSLTKEEQKAIQEKVDFYLKHKP